MNSQGQKIPYFEGADGKLYYNFAKGLKVEMHGSDRDKNEDYTLEIVGCYMSGETEYYSIALNGVNQPYKQSGNRISFLLSRYGVKTLAEGTRLELPLLVNEVKSYYEYRERLYTYTTAHAALIPEYIELSRQARGYGFKIGQALAAERTDEAAQLQAQQIELQRRANELLKARGINPDSLKELPHCDLCNCKGYTLSGVCRCALAISKDIKEYCAAQRLKSRGQDNE